MKNRYLLNELNFIEEAARELAGYDDASLLKEMEDAELEWELEKQRNPAKTREIMKSAEQGFSLLMARLQKEMVADGSLETEGKGECRKDTAESADDTESAEDQAGDKTPAGDKPAENRPVPYVRTGRMADHEGNAGCKAEGEGYTAAEADGEGDRRCRTDGGATGIIPPGESRMRAAADGGKDAWGIPGTSVWNDQMKASRETARSGAGTDRQGSAMDIVDQVSQENVCRTAETGFEKPLGTRKKMLRRVAILTAAAMVLGIGSFASVARQGYQVAEYPEQYGTSGSHMVRNNTPVSFLESEIEAAYKQIRDTLGIKALALDYIPKNMEFDSFILSNNVGVIRLRYKDKRIYLEEKVLDERETISVLVMDRDVANIIKNDWLEEELYLEENILDSGAVEYSIQMDTSSATYYLSGIMNKDEFIEIVEGLYFWN